MVKSREKKLVVKSNKLVEANYKLTIQEQRLIYKLITRIHKDDNEFKTHEFSVQEILEFLEVNDKDYYSRLKAITRSLISKVLTINEENGDLIQVSWLSSARYHQGEGKITLRFSPELKPYLLKLKEQFTQFEVKNVTQLKSSYSMRMYELMKQYEKLGERKLELEELKKMMQITQKSYDIYGTFKQKVILKAQAELKEKTDIAFDFEEIKQKRKVIAIRFMIHRNGPKAEQIKLDEAISTELQRKIDMLTIEGVDEKRARKLANKFSVDRIEKNIAFAKRKNPENLGAYIHTAATENLAKAEKEAHRGKQEASATEEDDKYKDIYMT